MKIYSNFEEVEKEVFESTPPVIYKYRNWENAYHKTIITKQELFFAHPHSLNDPYDVRPPYNFVFNKIDMEKARIKIREAGKALHPELSFEQLEQEVEKRLHAIKQDPIQYFKQNRNDFVHDRSKYNNIGVISFCSSFDNESMWAHYGNNYNGFAIGFKTVYLAKLLDCIVGYVDYNDIPLDYFIMGDNSELLSKEIFRKSSKWVVGEQEIRFVTMGIGLNRCRLNTFQHEVVEEIVFGLNTSKETQDEISNIVKNKMPNVLFYKLKCKVDAYGFFKERINN